MVNAPKPRRVCVFLLQLGGPDTSADIEPFLRNLFEDVLPVPRPVRRPLGRFIAHRRAPHVAPLYQRIGGASPIRGNTEAQAASLEQRLKALGLDARVLVVMRYSSPRAADALDEARRLWSDASWVALPLYPQYSFATTRSSIDELTSLLTTPEQERLVTVTAYPADESYLDALAECVDETLGAMDAPAREDAHLLFSAHSLPLRLVRQGDPYPAHVSLTVAGVTARLQQARRQTLPTHLAYQSRVGPVRWLAPASEQAVRRLGAEGVRALVVVPVSFVSEHIETLYELDVQLRETATAAGIGTFVRVPTLGVRARFIAALAELVLHALPHTAAAS